MKENMHTITKVESFAMNAIALALHHKEHCNQPDCGVSLYQLRQMAEEAGATFTDEQKQLFI